MNEPLKGPLTSEEKERIEALAESAGLQVKEPFNIMKYKKTILTLVAAGAAALGGVGGDFVGQERTENRVERGTPDRSSAILRHL